MAKKKRVRIWWFPVIGDEVHKAQRRGVVGNVEREEYPFLFDRQDEAYAYALSMRLEVIRENGEAVVNEQGYAQLRNNGRITLIGLKGQKLDWKKAHLVEVPGEAKGECIALDYNPSVRPEYVAQVFEETDKLYYRYITSPIAKAGGVVIPKELLAYHGTIATEALASANEQGAGDQHADELAGTEVDGGGSLPAALRELGEGYSESASSAGSNDNGGSTGE